MSKRVVRNKVESRKLPQINGKHTAAIGLDRFPPRQAGRLDLFKARTPSMTRNLIGYLLGHGERAQRATLPRKQTRLRVYGHTGKPAIRLHIGQ